ncbi:hypothetical protein WICPIJ_001495 [Wickerhamomyces pijperi]|uniref:Mitochondrial genome maintenance protein MGM101 n=1 Tax=Wickerhamomyces pijperi TaxID=599730 RepID=A0A9P8QAU6_WICPI|nr:hypothetical protein WICPIJ_001495 [Wickerhamomyces pijperi]
MMLRSRLVQQTRSYAVYTKRAAFSKTSPIIKKKIVPSGSSSSTKLEVPPNFDATTGKTIPATPTTSDPTSFLEPDQFNPPEFALQSGQSDHIAPLINEKQPATTANALKARSLDDIYETTLHDTPSNSSSTTNANTNTNTASIHWPDSYYGLAQEPFSSRIAQILAEPINPQDIEIKPDGLIYLPEIKYRRILNRSFGPGAWGLAPRSETSVTASLITREYALICLGRLVSVSRGEQDYFSQDGIPTATEGCKSNALMRCCKDLGIASELWDPVFIRKFKREHCEERFVEHAVNKRKRKVWKRKDRAVEYPYKLV